MKTTGLDIGLDIGFRQVKGSINNEDFKFDSVIGYPSSMEWKEESKELKPLDNIVLQMEDTTYYVGQRAIRETKNAQLTFTADKTDDKTDMLKVLSALGYAMKDNKTETFSIVSGLPVEELEVTGLKESMIKHIKGQHTFTFNHQEKVANVDSVIIIAQSAGAYYDYILKENGEVNTKKVLEKMVVIDIGFRTTDVVTMVYGKYIPSESFTIYNGMSNVHVELRRRLLKDYRIQKHLSEMDSIVRNGYLIINGEKVSIETELREALSPIAEKISSELPVFISNLREVDKFLITGGGATLMEGYFQKALTSSVERISHPEEANARGYFKYLKLLNKSVANGV